MFGKLQIQILFAHSLATLSMEISACTYNSTLPTFLVDFVIDVQASTLLHVRSLSHFPAIEMKRHRNDVNLFDALRSHQRCPPTFNENLLLAFAETIPTRKSSKFIQRISNRGTDTRSLLLDKKKIIDHEFKADIAQGLASSVPLFFYDTFRTMVPGSKHASVRLNRCPQTVRSLHPIHNTDQRAPIVEKKRNAGGGGDLRNGRAGGGKEPEGGGGLRLSILPSAYPR